MFEKIKKQMNSDRVSFKSIVTLVIFGSIILVFVVANQFQPIGGTGYAAQVGKVFVTVGELERATQNAEQQATQSGQSLTTEQRKGLRGQTAQRLVNQELLFQLATDNHLSASDAEVASFISTEMPAFQTEGRFQKLNYLQLLQANGLTPEAFEKSVDKQQSLSRIARIFETLGSETGIEVKRKTEISGLKANVLFVRLNREQAELQFPVTPAEAQHALNDSQLKEKVNKFYSENKNNYKVEEQVTASHILIKTDSSKPESEAAALAKIQGLLKQIKAGADFSALAKKFSEDEGSKTNGGSLGSFTKGRMVPEFEAAAFSQPLGQVGEVVKTSFGYHIIKVTARETARQKELAEVQTSIAQRILAEEKLDNFVKAAEAKLTKNDSNGLEEVLKANNQSWKETGLFDFSTEVNPALGSSEATLAAFELTNQAPLLTRVVRDQGSRIIMKLKEQKKEAVVAAAPDSQTNIFGESYLKQMRAGGLMEKLAASEAVARKVQLNQNIIFGR